MTPTMPHAGSTSRNTRGQWRTQQNRPTPPQGPASMASMMGNADERLDAAGVVKVKRDDYGDVVGVCLHTSSGLMYWGSGETYGDAVDDALAALEHGARIASTSTADRTPTHRK